MKKSTFLILVFSFFISLPTNSNPNYQKNNFNKMRNRFEKIDKNGDGLLSKGEMIDAHSDRIDNLFKEFDKSGDNKLSRKELRAIRHEMKKRIYKLKNQGE